jgi:hypothetical protein
MNTKVGDNFVEHNLDNKFALFGVRTWEIRHPQGRVTNQEVWTMLSLWKQSSLLSQGRSHARQVGARPKALQGHKYNPLGAQGGVINPSNHQRVADTKEKHREEADGRRKSSSCLGDGLDHALAAMVGPAW